MSSLIAGNECPWTFECPKDWAVLQQWGEGFACQSGADLRAIIDCTVKEDGRWWLHLSVSRRKWTPTHEDMAAAKKAFLGDRYAYAVWPPESRYVNIHHHCLHLWARFDGVAALPEFSEIVAGIGRSI